MRFSLPPVINVLESRTEIASGNGPEFAISGMRSGVTFSLDVSAASGTTPTLDLKIQTSFDGVTWFDVLALAQANSTNKIIRSIHATSADTGGAGSSGSVFSTSTLPADFEKCHFGPRWRSRWIIGGTTPSFTFAVKAQAF